MKMVNDIVSIVKSLPTNIGDIAIQMRGFVKSMFSVVGNSAIDEVQSITKEVRDFLEGIQRDALKFYNVSLHSCIVISHISQTSL